MSLLIHPSAKLPLDGGESAAGVSALGERSLGGGAGGEEMEEGEGVGEVVVGDGARVGVVVGVGVGDGVDGDGTGDTFGDGVGAGGDAVGEAVGVAVGVAAGACAMHEVANRPKIIKTWNVEAHIFIFAFGEREREFKREREREYDF